MSRLQKKCFIGAMSMHGLLLLAVVVGPGFFNKQTMDDASVIEFIPMMASPDNSTGGGSPRPPANNPQPPTIQPTVQPPPPPPEVRQEQVEKVEKVEPVKPEPEKNLRPDPDALVVKPEKPKPHQVKTSGKVVKLATAQQANKNPTTAKTEADANAKANEAWKKAVANAGKNINSGLSSSTKIDMPEGPGGGGVSYAPYGQIVRKIYTDGWTVPDDMTDDEATIKVSVTIKSDGTVLSSRIVQPSSSAAANRSIQNTLDRITTIGVPFPAGAKESQRTFIMTFNLKAKKAFG